jgi:hypothetical protein
MRRADQPPQRAGGIGQPLSLLMKMNPLVGSLSLYDMVGTHGVAADLSHMNTRAHVTVRARGGRLLVDNGWPARASGGAPRGVCPDPSPRTWQ